MDAVKVSQVSKDGVLDQSGRAEEVAKNFQILVIFGDLPKICNEKKKNHG